MNIYTKFLIAASVSASLIGIANAATFNTTATISNAITLTETTPLTLGSIYIKKDNGLAPTVTSIAAKVLIDPITGDETVTPAAGGTPSTSAIVMLGGSSPGILSVTGAAAFADVAITIGTVTVGTSNLVHSSGNPALPRINILAITAEADDADNGATLTLDGSGNGNILVGGTFAAEDYKVTASEYADGTYTGTYNVSVAY